MRLTIIGTMGVSTGTKYIMVVNSSDKLLLIMNYEETTSLGPDSKYKVVFLGDSAVGKTSIVERIAYGKYDDAHSATVILDTVRKNVFYKDRNIKLLLWDTAGQQKYNSLIPSSIRDNHCAVLVYDVSNPESFRNCVRWRNMIEEVEQGMGSPCILVANKVDLQRKVSQAEGFEWALQHKMSYLEVSAKTGSNIQNLVWEILEGVELMNKSEKSTNPSEITSNRKVTIDEKHKVVSYREPAKSSCCSI